MLDEVALLALMTAIVPVAACPPELDLDVVAEHHPPTVQSSYSLDQLREFATRLGRQGKHEVLGFYTSNFGYTVDVEPAKPAMSGCRPAVVAKVKMILGDRVIEIGADLQNRECRRDLILSHYMLHAQFDDRALTEYANRALDALRQMPTTELFGNPPQGNVKDTATEAIRRALDKVLLSYDREREQTLALADSPEELNKVAGACRRTL